MAQETHSLGYHTSGGTKTKARDSLAYGTRHASPQFAADDRHEVRFHGFPVRFDIAQPRSIGINIGPWNPCQMVDKLPLLVGRTS